MGACKKYIDNSEFKKQQENYLKNRSNKSAWDYMFFTVLNCITSCIKKDLKGKHGRNDIHDIAMDATAYLMGRYKKDNNFRIEQFEYMCKMTAFSFLHRPSQIRKDRERNLLDWEQNNSSTMSYNVDFITDIERRTEEKRLRNYTFYTVQKKTEKETVYRQLEFVI